LGSPQQFADFDRKKIPPCSERGDEGSALSTPGEKNRDGRRVLGKAAKKTNESAIKRVFRIDFKIRKMALTRTGVLKEKDKTVFDGSESQRALTPGKVT